MNLLQQLEIFKSNWSKKIRRQFVVSKFQLLVRKYQYVLRHKMSKYQNPNDGERNQSYSFFELVKEY